MSQQETFQEGALKVERLTFWEAVCIVVGANIGAGILSLAFGIRKAGWPILVLWLIVSGVYTTISMLYVAETTLRTRTPLQLSGLANKYLGQFGSWAMFAAVAVNSLGCLIAYTTGSGKILSSMLGVPPTVGSIIFFIPSIAVIWLGLKATGVAEKVITFGMVILVLILIAATILGPGLKPGYLTYTDWSYAVPVFNLALFCFIAQYAVPELARGFIGGDATQLPKSISLSMLVTGILLALVPMSALGLSGPEQVSEVATISWGKALGQWAYFTANAFALCAMITSFWAVGETFLTNIVDRLHFPSEWDRKYRLISLAIVVVPPFYLAYSGLVGFVGAIYFAGAFAGVVMSIIPVMMLREARRTGDRTPEWTCGVIAHPAVQYSLIIIFCGGAIYAILDLLKVLPHGW